MKCKESRALSDEDFNRLAHLDLTPTQIAELEAWADEFEGLPLNMQVCLAHFVVHDFLNITGEEEEDSDPAVLPAKFGGQVYG